MNIEKVFLFNIRPPHEVRDRAKLGRLTTSMRRKGWDGPPVLVISGTGQKLEALNGSHRLAAANEAGLDQVPVFWLDEELRSAVDDDARRSALRTALALLE